MKKAHFSAFTLIELLTVIAIIGILAAILIPTVAAVRDSARASVCVSNLRQLHAAMVLYANDHDDRLPVDFSSSAPNWHADGGIEAYIESDPRRLGSPPEIYRCPAREMQGVSYSWWHIDYGMNYLLSGPWGANTDNPPPNITLSGLTEPTRVMLLNDWRGNNRRSAPADATPGRIATIFRHKERSNHVFVDGHVRAIHFDDFPTENASSIETAPWPYGLVQPRTRNRPSRRRGISVRRRLSTSGCR